MFESHFGFIRRPFSASPDVEMFVHTERVRETFQSLEYCLSSGQGIAVLTAPAGFGKTMICQALAHSLNDRFAVASLPSPGTCSRLGLLQAIYFSLGKRVRKRHAGITDLEMRQELIDSVRGNRVTTAGVALLVDEAHLLDEQLLEEIRILASFTDRAQPLIRPLVCGHPQLDEQLFDPALHAFAQRIRCQQFLEALNRAESQLFIEDQLRRAGVRNRVVFEPDALQRIIHVADGIPRCLNQLCDHSLLLAARAGDRTVSIDIVESAIEELVQLPLAWNYTPRDASAPVTVNETSATQPSPPQPRETSQASVVEFGSLEDEFESVPADRPAVDTSSSGLGSASPPATDDTLFIDIGPLVDEEHEPESSAPADTVDVTATPVVETQINGKSGLLPESDEPTCDPDRREQETVETFRQGLPQPPVQFDNTPIADLETALAADPEGDVPAAALDDPARLQPVFPGADADPDLFPDSFTRTDQPLSAQAFARVAAKARALELDDRWTETEQQVRRPGFRPQTVALSAEEELLRSCAETRREIASMLDTLESHVSESLVDQYDVVMPESELQGDTLEAKARTIQSPGMPSAEDPVEARLRRTIGRERGLH